MEEINKISDTALEITKTEEVKKVLTKEDIERNINQLEQRLIKSNLLLNYFNTYTEQGLFDLTKAEQIVIINSFGETTIPQYEADRVALILTLQGGTI